MKGVDTYRRSQTHSQFFEQLALSLVGEAHGPRWLLAFILRSS